MKKFLTWGMALLMAGSLAGCGSSDAPAAGGQTTTAAAGAAAEGQAAPVAGGEATFTLGLICPLSGSSAVSGQILKNATEMAVNEINAAGGINGEILIALADVMV